MPSKTISRRRARRGGRWSAAAPSCSARAGTRSRSGRRSRREPRGRWSGSTWTSRTSTTPTTRSVYAPNRDHVLKRCARNSEIVRERLGAPKRFAYGADPMEALDVFTTKAANAPVNVFVHGGAWRTGLAKDYAIAAEMFVNAGAHLVVLDFNNVLETGGDLMVMAEQVRRGVPGSTRTPRASAGIPSGSTSAAIRPAGISPACC